MEPERRYRVLFVCTKNACRSQLAEAWANAICSETVIAVSAGSEPGTLVDSGAVTIMRQFGLDISHKKPKTIDCFDPVEIDCVITVCDNASTCPCLRGFKRVVHFPFDDPTALATTNLDKYMVVCQQIRDFVQDRLVEIVTQK